MWRLSVWICNTPTHTQVRKKKVLITSCSTALRSCPWAGEQRNTGTAAPDSPQMWGSTPVLEPGEHQLHMGCTHTWALAHRQRKEQLLCFPTCTSWVFQCRLVWEVESWLFSHTAPSKVWSTPMHVGQNIFGMRALKCCLSPAAMGWAGFWRRIVSLSSGTPSQGVLNWGSHVSTCTFLWVYT